MDCSRRCWPDDRDRRIHLAASAACVLLWLFPFGAAFGMRGRAQPSAPHDHPGHFTTPRRQLASQESPPGERGLSGYPRKCQRMIPPPRRAATLSVPSIFISTLCMRIRHSRLGRPPRTALRQTRPTRHGNTTHELRPGALTRPRRLCPTSGETPKPLQTLPPPGPETRSLVWR